MSLALGTVTPVQQLTDAWHQWAYGVLNAIGAPTTPTNLQTLWKWSIKESGRNPMTNGAIQNNPLNTTQPVVGSYAANSVGVQSFPDVSTSVNATAMTLLNGRYGAIVNNLRNSVPTQQWGADAGQQLGVWGSGTNWLGWSASPPASSSGGLHAAGSGSRTAGSVAGSNALTNPNGSPAAGGGLIDLSGLGNAIGGQIGGSITQSFSQFAWVALMAAGALLMLGGFAILAVSAFQNAPAPIKKAAGTAASLTPVGRGAKVAKSAKAVTAAKATKPAPPAQERPRITAGGREITVTNPESRARLRAAGYET